MFVHSPLPTAFLVPVALVCGAAWAPLEAATPPSGPPQVEPAGEDDAEGWNSPRVLELVERARASRAELAASGDLTSYRADTQGHIYFFLDPESGERPLIRIDQVVVDVRWQAPDRFQQHILGHRSEVRLPVRDFAYYLDRLTLVRHGFGDEIRIGAGRDVAGVPHPFASPPPGAGGAPWYDVRLADSLTLSLPNRPEPLRIYEVAVRPRDASRPGMVGSIFVDRSSASVVRMDFTFTPSSYTDPRNDRVSVYLDYGLWEDRYWLPNLQRIEVRREIPQLDIGVGTMIRSVLRVREYDLNVPISGDIGTVPRVTTVPEEMRETYPFPEGLYAGIERDGLDDLRVGVDPAELRARAFERLRSASPSGLSPLRLHVPAVSSAVRFDRVQGLRLGAGGSFRPSGATTIRVRGAHPFGDGRPQASASIETLLSPDWTASLGLRVRDLADLGLVPGSAPILSTAGAAVRGEDYLDPYWLSDAGLRLERAVGEDAVFSFGFGVERHASATRAVDSAPFDPERAFRSVRPVHDGEFFRAGLGWSGSLDLPAGGAGWIALASELLHGRPGGGQSLEMELDGRWGPDTRARELRLRATGWGWTGDPLPQGHRLLGGRGTVPGFAYRSFGGRQAAHASLTVAGDLAGPLLRLRAGLHGGWADDPDAAVASSWGAGPTGGAIGSVSVGVGVGWDLLRLDLARGLGGGEWQLLLSLDPGWWDLL